MESEIIFGLGGSDDRHIISGFSGDEPGMRWAIGTVSSFKMSIASESENFILELEGDPYAGEPDIPLAQRVFVSCEGQFIGACSLAVGTTMAFELRRPDKTVQDVTITIEHPDSARPVDTGRSDDGRSLAVALTRARLFAVEPNCSTGRLVPSIISLQNEQTIDQLLENSGRLFGLKIEDLVARFESIGQDCEFGLFQRRCGAEPLGLFRFADISIRNLIHGLDSAFDQIGNPDFISAVTYSSGGDFHIHHSHYKFRYHTFSYPSETTAESVSLKHSRLLLYGRRVFLERIANAERIFVFKRNVPVSDAEALALYHALNRRGPATLLYVVPSDQNHCCGSVEAISKRLMKGYLDRFWDGSESSISIRHWLEICMNANALYLGEVE